MSDTTFIDARGLSCPEPVLMTLDALRQLGSAAFTVAVSSPTSRDNVSRTLEDAGRKFAVTPAGDGWKLEVAAT